MKIKLIILINLFVGVLYAQKSAICTYKIVPKMENFEINKTDNVNTKYAKELTVKAFNVAKGFDYTLKFNKTESSSQISESMINEGENKFLNSIAKALVGKGVFYQNKLQKTSLWQTNVMGELYLVKDSLVNDWEISNESKKIGNYTCYKAVKQCTTCSSMNEVWFTPEIPVPFGPLGYGGLPGLIVSVVKKGSILQLEKIKFYNKPLVIEKPDKGKKIVKAEYDMITSSIRDNAKKMSN
jgi:GLPGLI family protein